ncbi:uncharacterized protein LOC116630282 [Phoca vitulina]|uniref:uncharacterized protein LOC116630282 n=1 Tax=Phoca vitulina TaxID=9720 RepID=UPI0013963942|nr:uncharacterized protein LOC116630282 [Phoca vitulina]
MLRRERRLKSRRQSLYFRSSLLPFLSAPEVSRSERSKGSSLAKLSEPAHGAADIPPPSALRSPRTEQKSRGNLGVPLAAPTALSLVLVGGALENTLEGVRAHLTMIPFRYKPVRAAGKTLAKTVKEKTILSKQSLGSASSAPTPTATTFAPSKENTSDSIVQIIQTTKRISGSGGDKKQGTGGRRGKAHQPKQCKGQHHSSHPAETSSFFNTFSLEQSILLSTPISSTS